MSAERFLEFRARFLRERDVAAPQVEAIRRDPPAEPSPDWMTLGFAYELCNATQKAPTPENAEALARLAIAITGRLGDIYRPALRRLITARAWTALATAYRARGRHADALAALDVADDAIGDDPVLGWDEAAVALCRAGVLSDSNRQEEALALLGEARTVFEKLSDRSCLTECELLRGSIAHRSGDAETADRSYRKAFGLALAAGDLRTAGSAWLNLGALAAEGGRSADALDALVEARALFRELGAQEELARGDWSIGGALLAAGRAQEAIPLLSGARAAFRDLHMPEEGGLAGVALVEAFLVLGRSATAGELVDELIEEYRSHQLNQRALVALTYLRSLSTPHRRTAAHVRSYLARLRREPKLLFLLPDDG